MLLLIIQPAVSRRCRLLIRILIQQHSVILSSLLQHHEKEVVKINDTIQKVEKRALEVEKENDEVRQRSMKGNLVISTDISNGQKSAFVSDKLNANGARSKESELEMILRLIKDKTGVSFKKSEIAACHALARKKEAEGAGGAGGAGGQKKEQQITSYVLRVWDRKP